MIFLHNFSSKNMSLNESFISLRIRITKKLNIYLNCGDEKLFPKNNKKLVNMNEENFHFSFFISFN